MVNTTEEIDIVLAKVCALRVPALLVPVCVMFLTKKLHQRAWNGNGTFWAYWAAAFSGVLNRFCTWLRAVIMRWVYLRITCDEMMRGWRQSGCSDSDNSSVRTCAQRRLLLSSPSIERADGWMDREKWIVERGARWNLLPRRKRGGGRACRRYWPRNDATNHSSVTEMSHTREYFFVTRRDVRTSLLSAVKNRKRIIYITDIKPCLAKCPATHAEHCECWQ